MYTRNTKDLVYLLALAIVRFTATHERQLPTSIGVNEEKNAFGNKIAVLHTQSVRTIACTYAVRKRVCLCVHNSSLPSVQPGVLVAFTQRHRCRVAALASGHRSASPAARRRRCCS